MFRAHTSLLVALALALLAAAPALGATEPTRDELVRAKIAEIDAELAKLTTLRTELQELLGDEGGTPAPAPVSPKVETLSDTISFDGYTQLRYSRPSNDDSSFALRRARLNFRASPSAQSKLRLELSGDNSELRILQGWAEYSLSGISSVRAGQFVLPFGYELAMGVHQLLPLDRARTVMRPFADRWDNGLVFMRKATGPTPQVDLWIVNGQGRRPRDADNRKNVGIRLNWKPDWGQAGVSYQHGSYVDPTSAERTDRNALGVHAVYDVAAWMLSGEHVRGKALGHDLAGWYAQVARRLPNEKDRLFARYERYDPNRDATGDDFRALVVGIARALDAKNRVTLQYQDLTDAGKPRNEWAMEWQMGY